MKIAIVRGPSLNKWEMQNCEPLVENNEILAIISENPIYAIEQINLPIKKLVCLGEIFSRIPKGVDFLYQIFGDPQYLLGLEKAVFGFDIVHVAETASAYSSQAIKAKRKGLAKKVLVTVWESIPFLGDENPRRKMNKQLVLTDADHFLAVSYGAKQALLLEGAKEEKVSVIPMGIDLRKFKPEKKDSKLAEKLKIKEDDLIILSAGRLVWEKGFYDLLLAAKQLVGDQELAGKNLRVLIVGSGKEKENLVKLRDRLGLEKEVVFGQSRPYNEMVKIYNLADIFVLASIPTPTWQEQFGMVLIEAMACGVPVVSTRSGGIPETVGEAGILVTPNNWPELAGALKRLILDKKLRQRLSEKGRGRVKKRFDRMVVTRKIEEVYQRVIG